VPEGIVIIEASRSHSGRHTTLGRTSLEKGSVLGRDLYLTTHNTHNIQTLMPQARFKLAIPANEWPQTHAVHRAHYDDTNFKTQNFQP